MLTMGEARGRSVLRIARREGEEGRETNLGTEPGAAAGEAGPIEPQPANLSTSAYGPAGTQCRRLLATGT